MAEQYPIEKGIPVPALRGRVYAPRYPWDDMVPGDSFFVPAGPQLKSIQSMAYKAGKVRERRYFAAPELDGVRVWRVK